MKSIKVLALTAVVAASLSACAIAPSDAGIAFLVNNSTTSGHATSATVATKEGRACANNILGWVITGDSSIATAKRNGGISKVASVDREINQVVVFNEVCTVVRGN